MTIELDQPQNRRSNKKVKGSLWIQLRIVISDYYDYIIADIIKGLMAESTITVDVHQILQDIRMVYVKFWQDYFQEEFKVSKNTRNLSSEANKRLTNAIWTLLKHQSALSTMMQEYVVNILSNMGTELPGLVKYDKFTESYRIDQEYFGYLTNFIREYILTNYFDQVVVGQAFKIILYSQRVSYGEVWELRQQLIELFRNVIYDSKELRMVRIAIHKWALNLNIPQPAIKLLESIVYGFVLTYSHQKKDLEPFMNMIKAQLNQRERVIKNIYMVSPKENIDIVMEWVRQQLKIVFETIGLEINGNDSSFASELLKIYSKQVRLLDSGAETNKILQEMVRKYKLPEIELDPEIRTETDSNTDTMSVSCNNHFSVLNSIEIYDGPTTEADEPEPMTSNEFFVTMVTSISQIITQELDNDPTLEKFVETIQKAAKAQLPGGDEYYI